MCLTLKFRKEFRSNFEKLDRILIVLINFLTKLSFFLSQIILQETVNGKRGRLSADRGNVSEIEKNENDKNKLQEYVT